MSPEAQWQQISIGEDNEALTRATIHYEIIGSGECGTDGDGNGRPDPDGAGIRVRGGAGPGAAEGEGDLRGGRDKQQLG